VVAIMMSQRGGYGDRESVMSGGAVN